MLEVIVFFPVQPLTQIPDCCFCLLLTVVCVYYPECTAVCVQREESDASRELELFVCVRSLPCLFVDILGGFVVMSLDSRLAAFSRQTVCGVSRPTSGAPLRSAAALVGERVPAPAGGGGRARTCSGVVMWRCGFCSQLQSSSASAARVSDAGTNISASRSSVCGENKQSAK